MTARRFVHVTIHGRVQGVGFRAFIERAAQERALDGWVRNRDDGTVEAVFAGRRRCGRRGLGGVPPRAGRHRRRPDRPARGGRRRPDPVVAAGRLLRHADGLTAGGGSTGPPASRHAEKPPPIWATGLRPMSCAVAAASAERQPPAQKKTKRLSCGEDRLVVGAVRIDPEFQHAARAMHGARDAPLALELARVAQVDEDDVVAAVQRQRLGRRHGLDLAVCLVEESLVTAGDRLGHEAFSRRFRVLGFSLLDVGALAFFVVAWLSYHIAVEVTPVRHGGLNVRMNEHRRAWMEQMLTRENRIIDANIMASLQNGTAFFASTSLIAIGGVLTLLRATDDVVSAMTAMPFGLATTRLAWELKVIGLAVIFVYAFYKFAWSYRIFNYAAILVGAVPPVEDGNRGEAEAAARHAAAMNIVAGRHFNRGQRAFFLALAYLGWFVSAYIFMAGTAACLFVMWRRQFASDAIAALGDDAPA